MSVEDVGVLRSIPGIVIFEPVDEVQLRAAMPALDAYEGPVYVRLVRAEQPAVFGEGYEFELFRADKLREGSDLTICVSGLLTRDCLDAAEELAREGISCELLNLHTLKPLDREAVVASARKTGAVLTVENHNILGGLHAAVLEALALERVPVWAVGVEDRFGEVGKLPYLRKALGLSKEDILAGIRRALQLKVEN
jgi:transketolase